jgi:hypothetical protein
MFGMSSTDFWENDPQLYWAYRTFYLKKQEYDNETNKYTAWLNGNTQCISTQIAIGKTFGKNQQIEYPQYKEMFSQEESTKTDKKLTKQEINLKVQEEFNSWARF